MYDIEYDILVNEEKMQSVAKEFKKRAGTYEKELKEYQTLLSDLVSDTVMEGEAAKNLSLFERQVRKLSKEAEQITKEIVRLVEKYHKDMDEADSYIY